MMGRGQQFDLGVRDIWRLHSRHKWRRGLPLPRKSPFNMIGFASGRVRICRLSQTETRVRELPVTVPHYLG